MTNSADIEAASDQHPEAQLLSLVQQVAGELHPERSAALSVGLDTSLERDLGMDSLGRMELLSRIEGGFGMALPDHLFAAAETPRELLRLIQAQGDKARIPTAAGGAPLPLEKGSAEIPGDHIATLLELVEWHVERHPERPHITLYDDDHQPLTVTYGELLSRARCFAAGLQQRGLREGETVAIMLPTSTDYFYSFLGILLAGGVPVPIYPPARLSQIEDHLRRHTRILENAQSGILITVEAAKQVAALLKSHLATLNTLVTPAELANTAGTPGQALVKPANLAFLQYTSGSTGNPKGVSLSHANLITNVRTMGKLLKVQPEDTFVSWLPLYHDMGLIGAWMGSLYYAMHLVVMSPLAFLARPQRWLTAIGRHRGTISAAPNFAYELCLQKIPDEALGELDLSSWRFAFNGAEPVSPQTIRRFSERFAGCGFRAEAMAPVYGLAESSVGLALPPHQRLPPIDRVVRDALVESGRAEPADEGTTQVLEFPACGHPLPGHQIRIVDASGGELPERREGRLQFRGPSCTSGYYRNPEATRALFDGEWLDSGDMAYIAGGDIYLTGRAKDIIIRAGRNIYPHEVEEAVGDVEGVRKGCVAVFGCPDRENQTERLIVLAETRQKDEERLGTLREQVSKVATDLLGTPPDEVVLAPPHVVLKTSSGKIRRAASRERYLRGETSGSGQAVWRQFARLIASSLVPRLGRFRNLLLDRLYSVYTWMLFSLVAPLVWALTPLIPGLPRRWGFIHSAARLLTRLAGIPLRVDGTERLQQAGPMIVMANHASYLDGVILAAALPRPMCFVVKGELRHKLLPRIFLQAIGSVFVERLDPKRSAEGAQQLVAQVDREYPLFIFPEGTFHRMPGLLPFHMGGFLAAAETGTPVLPLAVRGSRYLMRPGTWMPRRGRVTITLCPPQAAAGSGWPAAIELRNRVREQILLHNGEPDLAHENAGPRHAPQGAGPSTPGGPDPGSPGDG